MMAPGFVIENKNHWILPEKQPVAVAADPLEHAAAVEPPAEGQSAVHGHRQQRAESQGVQRHAAVVDKGVTPFDEDVADEHEGDNPPKRRRYFDSCPAGLRPALSRGVPFEFKESKASPE